MKHAAALLLLASLSACGSGAGERQGVGGVTADEAAQLNAAAEMLDSGTNLAAAPDAAADGNADAAAAP